MYTRSYNIQTRKTQENDTLHEPLQAAEKPEAEPVAPQLSEGGELPLGYSGTAMLRENVEVSNSSNGIALSEIVQPAETDERPVLRRHKPVKFAYRRSEAPKLPEAGIKETAVPIAQPPDIPSNVCQPMRKKTEIDRLLVGALMLLLLNEHADDILIILLGYIFI